MTLDEIREFAHALEIQSVSRFENKEDLIRTIQLAEGHTDCFGQTALCEKRTCTWHADCKDCKIA